MTDRAFEPPSPDPFAQPGGGDDSDNPFGKIMGARAAPAASAKEAPPAANDDDADNPFGKIMGSPVAPASSATGAFARGAARGILPALGSIPAIGAGAEAGGALGLLGGPAAPITVPLGAFAGGIAGGFLGGTAIAAAQNWALSKLPDSWTEAIGMSDRQEKLDATYHGTASFLGGLAPYAVTMRPSIAKAAALPDNATALQRIMAHPATAHLFGGAVMGGMELGQEAASGEPADWGHVAIATGFGVVFNKPTPIGERLMNAGGRPVRGLLGRPEPTEAPQATPATETQPGAAPEAGQAPVAEGAPQEASAPTQPVTAGDWRSEILERTRRGFPNELPPTVADAADLGVMGPGRTEDTFQGSHESDPSAVATARETKRTEQSVIAPPEPALDPRPIARRMDPELFTEYDALLAQRAEHARWIEDHNNPGDEAVSAAEAKRDAIQKELDAHVAERKGYSGGADARRLRAQVRDAQRDIDELEGRRQAHTEGTAEQTPELIQARQHLLATDIALRDLHPRIQAAYRRAAESGGSEIVEPVSDSSGIVSVQASEPSAKEPVATTKEEAPQNERQIELGLERPPITEAKEPVVGRPGNQGTSIHGRGLEGHREHVEAAAPVEAQKPRTIEEQRDFIRGDVIRQTLAAGKPTNMSEAQWREHADLAAAVIVANYETRARWFKGAIGTPEELYRAEGAEILGPNMQSKQPPGIRQPREPRKVNEERLSLLPFLAHRGGLKPTADLESALGKNPSIPGFGKLFRETGMTEDRAREAASEAGYLTNQEREGDRASIRDLHSAINDETRGRKRYRMGHEPEAGAKEGPEEQEHPEALEPEERGEQPAEYASELMTPEDEREMAFFQAKKKYSDAEIHQAIESLSQYKTELDPGGQYISLILPSGKQIGDYVASHNELLRRAGVTAFQTIEHLGETTGTVRARGGNNFEIFAAAPSPQQIRQMIRSAKDSGEQNIYIDVWDHNETLQSREFELRSAAKEIPAFIESSLKTGTADEFHQGAQGKAVFMEGRRPVIRINRIADASTLMHEYGGHVFLEELRRDALHPLAPDEIKRDAETTWKWLNLKPGQETITGAQHEKWARGFEQYLREGVAPSRELASVFARFKSWLTSIYETLRGLGKPINEDIRQVFDRRLAQEPQRTVIAPEAETARSLADIHEADRAEARPEEADPIRDRIDAEWIRAVEDIPEDIRREAEADIAAKAAAEARATGQTPEPPGETGAGDGGQSAILGTGGKPEPQSAGGGLLPQSGALDESINATGPNGDRLPSAGPRPGDGEKPGAVPLASSPAATFPAASGFNVGLHGNVRTENISSMPQFMAALNEAAEASRHGDKLSMGDMVDLAKEVDLDASKIDEAKLESIFGGVKNLASKIWALREAVKEQSGTVHSLMQAVRDTGTDQSVFEYAKERARFNMMYSVLSSVTTESGRGTGMGFRNMEGWEKVKDTAEFLKGETGRTLFQLKMEAKLGAQLDSPAKIAKFMRDAQKRSAGGMILEYWINGLISGIATHMTYAQGNELLALWKTIPETLVASGIGTARRAMGREGERVYAGETLIGLKSMGQDLPKAVQAALEAIQSGRPTLLPGQEGRPQAVFAGDDKGLAVARSITNDPVAWREVGAQVTGMMRGLKDGLISGAELIKAGGEEGAPMIGWHWGPGQIPDIAIRGVPAIPVGSAIRVPGRSVAAIHSFFATSNYSREIAAMGYRQASEKGLIGNEFAAEIANVRSDPTPEQMKEAVKNAYASTLMSEGGAFVKALSQLTNATVDLPLIGELRPLKFIDPFVHIGANVINQAIVQRTPLGILSTEVRADLMGHNGNIAQDMAQALMLAGTALSLVFGGLAMQDYATGSGPSEPGKAATWRLAGYQAHSIRVGDLWYQVNRLGPMGMLMGVAADMYDVAHEASQGEMLLAAAHLQHAVTQNILDESFMRGPADLIKAIEDPGRYGEAYLKQFASSFVPYSVGLAQIARASDPYSRQARNVMDAIRAKIPGLSEGLFPNRDVWGEPMVNPDALGHAGLTAIYIRKLSDDPVNIEMNRLQMNATKIPRKIGNAELTDQQYDEYAQGAGHLAKRYLDRIVRSDMYHRSSDAVRKLMITRTITEAHKAAEGEMMSRHRDIAETFHKRIQ